MSTDTWQIAAVVAMVASLPLLAWAGNAEALAGGVAGGAVFTVGAAALTVLRFAPTEED
ncbi:hypothetical protein JD276_05705 [Leucobacter sp. CSA1]|uniref:Uncharacterized protein n=1 Tax=Leucobacter chromiisoli TaxID=2796471 RepID=A0A934Q806_9MICO|nr:hypothetical protein [Leucobacter chromiisoli]MBK0418527.1 hypothetical protein [Leucobacter chromiisoli]